MAFKTDLTEDEQYGLTEEEKKLATRYLRKHRTAGAIPDIEAAKIFEMYLIGTSFAELARQFPQYPYAQILLTAALKKWGKDRDNMMWSLKDRVKAKVVKSIIEQVDFLTSMLAVTNTEHLDAMRKYILDPANNPPPNLRIRQLKEYKETVETLQKLMTGVPGAKASSLLEALTDDNRKKLMANEDDDSDSEGGQSESSGKVISIKDVT